MYPHALRGLWERYTFAVAISERYVQSSDKLPTTGQDLLSGSFSLVEGGQGLERSLTRSRETSLVQWEPVKSQIRGELQIDTAKLQKVPQ